MPRWLLVLLCVAEAATALSFADTSLPVLIAALALPVLAAVLVARSPVAALAVTALTAAGAGTLVGNGFPGWLAGLSSALVLLAGLAGYRLGRARPAFVVFGVGVLASIAPDPLLHGPWSTSLFMLVLFVVLPWLVGHSLRQQARLGAAAAEGARLRERTALAHDMHDTLGHELSLLALRAGVLELADGLAPEHRAAVGELRAGAGAVTERLAGIVRTLRDGGPPALHPADEPVEDLVTRATEAGLPVTFSSTVDTAGLEVGVRRTVHRVVTEALTNAAKHAPGSAVCVRLDARTDDVELSVRNALPARTAHAGGSGTGLVSLDERVRLAGGSLRAAAAGGVFEVVAVLPSEPPEETPRGLPE